MKTVNRQGVGRMLIVAVIVFSALYQWLGPGLITINHPAPVTVPGGITVSTSTTAFHFALFPVVILSIVGVALAVIPNKHDKDVG